MKEAIYHFPTEGTPLTCEQIKSGHINETYLITTDNYDARNTREVAMEVNYKGRTSLLR